MRAFKLAFGITSGVGLAVAAVALAWTAAFGMYKRHVDASDAEVRCRVASAALASGQRAEAVQAFIGKVDEDLLFDLAEKVGVVQEGEGTSPADVDYSDLFGAPKATSPAAPAPTP